MKESGSIVRLEIQNPELSNSKLPSSIVVEFDLYELQARIDAIVSKVQPIYQFEGCKLSTGSRELIRDGHEIHLRPKVYRLLTHLIEHRSRAVSRDELCQIVWTGRCVGNATVDSTIKALRRAIGDDGSAQRLVQTISGFGYRFVAEVTTCTLSRETTLSPARRQPLDAAPARACGSTLAILPEPDASASNHLQNRFVVLDRG